MTVQKLSLPPITILTHVTSEITCYLTELGTHPLSFHAVKGSVTFRLALCKSSEKDEVGMIVSGALTSLKRMGSAPNAMSLPLKPGSVRARAVDLVMTMSDTWAPLLKSLEAYAKLCEGIAEVRYYYLL